MVAWRAGLSHSTAATGWSRATFFAVSLSAPQAMKDQRAAAAGGSLDLEGANPRVTRGVLHHQAEDGRVAGQTLRQLVEPPSGVLDWRWLRSRDLRIEPRSERTGLRRLAKTRTSPTRTRP